ncbi:patatin-like phospholipase family protein [Parabacteroides johnsonii]|nr:patatin-like phospholipase family protein [Parabacteroides johnsonii]
MKKKVALVLSMGGARGIAHIGVIEELLKQGFEITSIAGSSMGALVGAMYASGQMEVCKEWLYSWDKHKMWQLADISLSREGLVKGNRFIKELKEKIPDMNIENLPIPYVALATDIAHRKEVAFDKGNLHDAVRASISIPLLFYPLRKDGMVLMDGGIMNPIPLKYVKRTKNDMLIAVDVNAQLEPVKDVKINPRNIYVESSLLKLQQIAKYELQETPPDLLIQTSVDEYRIFDFYKAEKLVKQGVEATRKALELKLEKL